MGISTETVAKTADIGLSAPARSGDTLGYARVSTGEQNPDTQRDRLLEVGAIRVFTDVASGKRSDYPGLAELLDHARPGDRLCVTRLDRLGRSLRELLETVDDLKAGGIHRAVVNGGPCSCGGGGREPGEGQARRGRSGAGWMSGTLDGARP